jgi:hypothetical protein
MKRTWVALVSVVCLVLALSFAMAGCGGGGDIVGTWTDGEGMDFEFKSDGALIVGVMGQKFELSYEVKDSVISITDEGSTGLGAFLPDKIDYRVDGDELALISPDGQEQVLTRK